MRILVCAFAPLPADVLQDLGVVATDFDICRVPPATERGDTEGTTADSAGQIVLSLAVADIGIYNFAEGVREGLNIGGDLVGTQFYICKKFGKEIVFGKVVKKFSLLVSERLFVA